GRLGQVVQGAGDAPGEQDGGEDGGGEGRQTTDDEPGGGIFGVGPGRLRPADDRVVEVDLDLVEVLELADGRVGEIGGVEGRDRGRRVTDGLEHARSGGLEG